MDKQTFKSQLKRVYKEFRKEPQTMKQVSVTTGIDRPNICRYKAWLEKRGKIIVVKKGKCPITSHTAQFLSTDPAYFTPKTQPELFPTTNAGPYAL